MRGLVLYMLGQWRRNKNMIGGAGVRGYEAAYYPHEESACEGRELGGLKPLQPPQFRRPCIRLQHDTLGCPH